MAGGLISGVDPDSAPLAAANSAERDALGYLHANCGLACHHAGGGAPFSLRLELGSDGRAPRIASDTSAWQAINHSSGYTPPVRSGPFYRIRPTDPSRSTIFYRAGVRTSGDQMPPLGTHKIDPEGLARLTAWITGMSAPSYPAPAP